MNTSTESIVFKPNPQLTSTQTAKSFETPIEDDGMDDFLSMIEMPNDPKPSLDSILTTVEIQDKNEDCQVADPKPSLDSILTTVENQDENDDGQVADPMPSKKRIFSSLAGVPEEWPWAKNNKNKKAKQLDKNLFDEEEEQFLKFINKPYKPPERGSFKTPFIRGRPSNSNASRSFQNSNLNPGPSSCVFVPSSNLMKKSDLESKKATMFTTVSASTVLGSTISDSRTRAFKQDESPQELERKIMKRMKTARSTIDPSLKTAITNENEYSKAVQMWTAINKAIVHFTTKTNTSAVDDSMTSNLTNETKTTWQTAITTEAQCETALKIWNNLNVAIVNFVLSDKI